MRQFTRSLKQAVKGRREEECLSTFGAATQQSTVDLERQNCADFLDPGDSPKVLNALCRAKD